MKVEFLGRLDQFERDLRDLKKTIQETSSVRINRIAVRDAAEGLASQWVEEIRSPLEHKFGIQSDLILETSNAFKRLHVLARPNNRKASYLGVINSILKNFKNKFVLPIQQSTPIVTSKFDLAKMVVGLSADESEYLKEAIACANSGHHRAAIVLGWCAAIDRLRKKIQATGFAKFNATSTALKTQISGKHKRWNKEFSVTTLGELQEVFDSDLIIVCEGMGLLDGNEADRLIRVDFQYRNHSAHPGQAPVEEPHLVAFFNDIDKMILRNPRFAV